MCIISSVWSYKTHISYLFCIHPIYSLYRGYNYTYLILTNFMGSNYMSDFFCQNATYLEGGAIKMRYIWNERENFEVLLFKYDIIWMFSIIILKQPYSTYSIFPWLFHDSL